MLPSYRVLIVLETRCVCGVFSKNMRCGRETMMGTGVDGVEDDENSIFLLVFVYTLEFGVKGEKERGLGSVDLAPAVDGASAPLLSVD
jgi:hypothetical protein